MSLIADALKAAEREKARRVPPPPRANSQPEGYFALHLPGRTAGEPMVSPMVIGIGVAMAAIALLALVLTFSPSQRPETRAATPAFVPDSMLPATILETPGDDAGLALSEPDLGTSIPSDVADVAGFDEGPPEVQPDAAPARDTPRRPARADDFGEGAQPLPSLLRSTPPTPAPADRPGRLEITVDRPIQRSAGGGLFEQALAAQRRGDYQAAKTYYLQAAYLAPRNPELFNNLGTVYRALRELPSAEAAYRTATEVGSTFAPAWSNLGVVLGQQGRTQEAIAALQQALRLDPGNAAAKVNLAIQLYATGLLPDARKLLEDAIRIDPTLAEAHYELGRVLEKQNQRTAAIFHYGQFLSTAGGRFPEMEQAVRSRLRGMAP